MVDPRFMQALHTPDAVDGARGLLSLCGGNPPYSLVVLGSGLAEALKTWGEPDKCVKLSDIAGVRAPVADGHRNELRVYFRPQGPVLVALGRTHLYEGVTPMVVTALVRAAAVAGIERIILCNANGCLKDWTLGDVMVVDDHLNFSGTSPFNGTLFLDIRNVWDRKMTNALSQVAQRRGTYAFLRGPEYQTRAESRWLASTGVDCVGMSTVFEGLTAYSLGVRVCGLSVVSDLSFGQETTDPQAVVDAAARAESTVSQGIEIALNVP